MAFCHCVTAASYSNVVMTQRLFKLLILDVFDKVCFYPKKKSVQIANTLF